MGTLGRTSKVTLLHLEKSSKNHELFFEAFTSEPSTSWSPWTGDPSVLGSRRDLGQVVSDDEQNLYHQRVDRNEA